MPDTHTAFIALGANLGDPRNTIRSALDALDRTPGIRIEQVSSLYKTAPVGLSGQPDFVNAVARTSTTLPPQSLLEALLATEASFGRLRRERNGPRTLDLDLLLYDDLTHTGATLTLPHPRLHLRAFVLVPLAEITPDLPLPKRGTVKAWLPAVANQAIHRI